MHSDEVSDPFLDARREDGVLPCKFQGEVVPMILRHKDVRAAAKDWKTYSSDAPFRVPIPSEETMRTMRQLPIEVDPPEHKEYRTIVEPFFKRAKDPEVIAKVDQLITRMVEEAMEKESVEIVRQFSMPLQSYALTYLLNVPETEAEKWIAWGIHVFKDGDASDEKRPDLEVYLQEQFDRVEKSPGGEDFFAALAQANYQGRHLTREEMMGFGNLTFAGGRDTVIHTVSCVIGYLAKNGEALDFLREDPKRITHAVEEFFRTVTPLTHIGRVCPVQTDVHGVSVKPKGRVSLCWSSANQDETVFENPHEVQLDRKPNPHVAFGFGAHLCLGAAHARLIVRTLLQVLMDRVGSIETLSAEPHVEHEERYQRTVGYDSLEVRILPK